MPDAQGCENDEVSSFESSDEESKGETLYICKSHKHSLRADRSSLERHLAKKLKKFATFSSLDCAEHTLNYSACDYLADVIKSHFVGPLIKLDLTHAFSDQIQGEEIALALSTLLEAVEAKGIDELHMARNNLPPTCIMRLSKAL